MLKKIIMTATILLSFTSNAFYGVTFEQEIDKEENNKIVIDVITLDKVNHEIHFDFIKRMAKKHPEKSFRLVIHKKTTLQTVKAELFEKYKFDFSPINFNDYKMDNIEYYVCNAAIRKNRIKPEDVDLFFNKDYTSSKINEISKEEGYLILKEGDYSHD